MPAKNKAPIYVFVVGVARSGTTAITQLLNAHPSVCIGLERYKRFFRRERTMPAELFTKERFFSFEPTDTNVLPSSGTFKRMYDSMAQKWDSASVLGDKEGYAALDYIVSDIPKPRIIYMLRDVQQIASSWNVRSSNPKDGWPRNNDYRIAVNRWNEANSLAYLCWRSLRNRFLVVDYEKFFSGSNRYANTLLRFLGLEPGHPEFMEAYASCRQYYQEKIACKEPLVLDGQPDFIDREANHDTYERLSKIAMERLAKS